jgi:hypothetical protein
MVRAARPDWAPRPEGHWRIRGGLGEPDRGCERPRLQRICGSSSVSHQKVGRSGASGRTQGPVPACKNGGARVRPRRRRDMPGEPGLFADHMRLTGRLLFPFPGRLARHDRPLPVRSFPRPANGACRRIHPDRSSQAPLDQRPPDRTSRNLTTVMARPARECSTQESYERRPRVSRTCASALANILALSFRTCEYCKNSGDDGFCHDLLPRQLRPDDGEGSRPARQGYPRTRCRQPRKRAGPA